ncbi:MAG TPA: hypothetical protein VFK57_16035 [Vicinamibacterales bacterium]|nr:hypothetical protein [Vicinamibacterales bacterium]
MITSSGAAALVAQIAFWVILGIGVAFGELRGRSTAIFVLLWALGVFGLPGVAAAGGVFVAPYVAVLDIVLAFVVFKGDVSLS